MRDTVASLRKHECYICRLQACGLVRVSTNVRQLKDWRHAPQAKLGQRSPQAASRLLVVSDGAPLSSPDIQPKWAPEPLSLHRSNTNSVFSQPLLAWRGPNTHYVFGRPAAAACWPSTAIKTCLRVTKSLNGHTSHPRQAIRPNHSPQSTAPRAVFKVSSSLSPPAAARNSRPPQAAICGAFACRQRCNSSRPRSRRPRAHAALPGGVPGPCIAASSASEHATPPPAPLLCRRRRRRSRSPCFCSPAPPLRLAHAVSTCHRCCSFRCEMASCTSTPRSWELNVIDTVVGTILGVDGCEWI